MRRMWMVAGGLLISACAGQLAEVPPARDLDNARLVAMEQFAGYLQERSSVACAAFRDGEDDTQRLRDPEPAHLERLNWPGRTFVPVSECELRNEGDYRRHWAHRDTDERAVLILADEPVTVDGEIRVEAVAWYGMLGSAGRECTVALGPDGWSVGPCHRSWVSE